MTAAGAIIFGYRFITDPEVPRCPCADPGNYLCLQQEGVDPLRCRLLCWCGRSVSVTFASDQEKLEFVLRNGG